MAGRPKLYTEEELLDRATDVFWQKGYASTSAQDLMASLDIGQGSMYRTFKGGKREIFEKTLSRFLSRSIGGFHQRLNASDDPLQFLKDFFYMLIDRSPKEKLNGCYLGNSIVESSNTDQDMASHGIELLDKLKEGFETALIKAQNMGRLSKEKSPSTLALHLISFWNGFNITQRMYPNDQDLKELIELNLQTLE